MLHGRSATGPTPDSSANDVLEALLGAAVEGIARLAERSTDLSIYVFDISTYKYVSIYIYAYMYNTICIHMYT